MSYLIRTSIFSTGERFPVLLYSETYQPVSLVTRYIVDERRETKQSGTIERDVRVLRWLYVWADSRSIDLESKLRQGELLTLNEMTSFCRYLRTYGKTNLTGTVNYTSEQLTVVLSPQVFNVYIQVVNDFLVWAAEEFIPSNVNTSKIRENINAARNTINKFFKNKKQKGRNANVEGLDSNEILELCEVTRPGHKNNPFKKVCQLRNYLIIQLLLQTGIRRGELLKIKMKHLPSGSKLTVAIKRDPDDKEDSRSSEPQVKTLEREIPIPKALIESLWIYIRKHRKKGNHSFLFTSNKDGSPLSVAGVNAIFSLLVKKCFPNLKGRLYPHILRHTFNDRLVLTAWKIGWEGEQVMKLQKYLNGWTENSTMPQLYSRKATQAMANEFLSKYQEQLYKTE